MSYIINNQKEFDTEGKRYQKKLGLEQEKIEFRFQRGGQIIRDVSNTFWIIKGSTYNDIMHELGHLLFDNNPVHYNYSINYHPIFMTVNSILDGFINYFLIKHPAIPEFAKSLYRICLDLKSYIIKSFDNFDNYFLLEKYTLFYLTLNYILPNRESFQSKIWNPFLKKIHKKIVEHSEISEKIFINFQGRLDLFDGVKNTSDLDKIANFIHETIHSLEPDIPNVSQEAHRLLEKILL